MWYDESETFEMRGQCAHNLFISHYQLFFQIKNQMFEKIF